MKSDDMKRLVVVGLLESLPAGTIIDRRHWPAHVTVAQNFVVDASRDHVNDAVRRASAGEGPLPLRFAGEALFGPNHDVSVQLVDSPRLSALHDRLADLLEQLPGFAADQPEYWRGGYRPHLTHVPGTSVVEGDERDLPHLAIVQMTATTATVVSSLDLGRP